MPAVSKAQKGFMGADLARAEAGEPTMTGMGPDQLKDFTAGPAQGLPEKVKPKHKHHKKHHGGGGPGMIGAGRQPKPRGGGRF